MENGAPNDDCGEWRLDAEKMASWMGELILPEDFDALMPGSIFPELPPDKEPGDFLMSEDPDSYDWAAMYECSVQWLARKSNVLFDPPLTAEDFNHLAGPEVIT